MTKAYQTTAHKLLSAAALVSSLMFMPAVHAMDMPTGGPPAEYIDFLKMKPMQVMHMMDKGKGRRQQGRLHEISRGDVQ